MTLESQIESILFWRAEPVTIFELAKILEVKEEDVEKAVQNLERDLAERGVRLAKKDDEIELRTAPEASSLIETLSKEELSKDLGRAGLETISIILYQGPISRRDIDYIRGVNSTFIIRNLLLRDLIEKVTDPKDERVFLYRPSLNLLSYMGVSKIENIPDYEKVRAEIESFWTKSAQDQEKQGGQQEEQLKMPDSENEQE